MPRCVETFVSFSDKNRIISICFQLYFHTRVDSMRCYIHTGRYFDWLCEKLQLTWIIYGMVRWSLSH